MASVERWIDQANSSAAVLLTLFRALLSRPAACYCRVGFPKEGTPKERKENMFSFKWDRAPVLSASTFLV